MAIRTIDKDTLVPAGVDIINENFEEMQEQYEKVELAVSDAQSSAETAQSAAKSVSSSVAQIEQNKADIVNKLDKPATDGTAGQVLQLDEEGKAVWVENKAGLTEIPDDYITPEKTTFYTKSDIEYEIVEGKAIGAFNSFIKADDAFILFIKIPNKVFAWIATTPSNTVVPFGTSTRLSEGLICDADKKILGAYGETDTNRNLCVFGGDKVGDYEGATYFATSYTLGSTFDLKIGGVGVNTNVDIPIAETELPDDFIISGGNKITEIGTNVNYDSSNDRWIYGANYPYGITNFFEVENDKTYYHNGSFISVKLFDENYVYVGMQGNFTSGDVLSKSYDFKYAYAYSDSATGISDDFWFSDEDLSRKISTPSKVVNPKYFEVDLDRKHMNNWYNGKRASFMGDSLSDYGTGGVYISDLKDYFGFSNVTRTAIGGTYVSGEGKVFGGAFWQDSRVNAVDIDSDVIFIMGGTNDANNNVSLGDNDISNCDTNTFYGAYNVLISKLIYKFYKLEAGYYSDIDYSGVTQVETAKPVKIFLITPPYMLSGEVSYKKIHTFAEAVVNIGKLLGCPVCDTRANSDVNLFLADYYAGYRNNNPEPDFVHLSEEAHHHWASVIIGKMLEVEPIW